MALPLGLWAWLARLPVPPEAAIASPRDDGSAANRHVVAASLGARHFGHEHEELAGRVAVSAASLQADANPGHELGGQVTAGAAMPLGEAFASAVPVGEALGDDAPGVPVSHDGTFRITGLREGSYHLVVEAIGQATLVAGPFRVASGSPAAPLRLQFPAAAVLVGYCTGQGRGDVASLVAEHATGVRRSTALVAGAAYRLEGLAPGTHRVWVTDRSGTVLEELQAIVVAPGETQVLDLH